MSKLLTEQDFIDAAKSISVEVAAIKAVAEVESRGDGFLPDGRPKILFEAHVFSARTRHTYDETHPNISSKKWNRKLYKGGAAEYGRLEEAMNLNKIAAYQSASWGKFQVMGFNAISCGWNSVEQFVIDMHKSEGEHLRAFVGFVRANNLAKYLQARDWAKFAEGYNGAGYRENKYDERMKSAYEKYARDDKQAFKDLADFIEDFPIRPIETIKNK